MIEALQLYLSDWQTWFSFILVPLGYEILKRAFKFVRKHLTKSMDKHARRVAEYAKDDVLTTKVITSREAWLVIFVLGSLLWFGFIVLSPFRVFLTLGVPLFLLTMTPIWVLEVLFLSRDSFADEVLAKRK